MIINYFKQAWYLLKENRLYSTVYIIGTGLAIGMIMIIAIIYYVKIAPFYPETNRNRTLRMRSLNVKYKSGGMNASSLSYPFITDYLATLESVETVSALLNVFGENNYVENPQSGSLMPVIVQYTDTKYWKVFGFEFVNGQSYSEEEFRSAVHAVVISSRLALQLFGTTEVVGRRITLDSDEYRVSGVVRDASYATPLTYAQVWMPFTLRPEEMNDVYGEGYLGGFTAYILAPSAALVSRVEQEAAEMFQKINTSQDKYTLDPVGQPELMWKTYFHRYSNHEIDWWQVGSTFGIMIFALLLVPAVNLAGMVSSRMEKRLTEMGVRKAFGASRGTLVNQVLVENLLLTVFGGVVGLIISWIIIYTGRYWIFTIFDSWPQLPPEGADNLLSASMLFSPGVFIIALLVCLLLNVLSAIIPAWNGLKKNIVYSLNEKD